MSLHVFGIRHHGPGCARSLIAALDELQPDVVVVEGPADAEEALSWVANEGLKPPVALLLYPPDEPARGVYYPLTVFSPEWQAFRWATSHGVPIRLMDLPQANHLAIQRDLEQKLRKELEARAGQSSESREANEGDGAEEEDGVDPAGELEGTEEGSAADEAEPQQPLWRTDPIALLAEAAGYKDHELWWENEIERRTDAAGLFEAILEGMRAVRDDAPPAPERDLIREAFMRQTIRRVMKEGLFQKIAILCGAWHAPVLDEESVAGRREGCRIKDDEARLKKLPKVKTTATWIPWTHSRLSYRSGYGAGVESPGWYAHVWETRDQAPLRWIATAARLLRTKDLDASSASVIEAVRLADALAAIRELRSPGLAELNEAILAVLCHGDGAPMRLIRRQLEVGDVMGEVPPEAPSTPLAQDLADQQKSLRLKPSTEIKAIDLDLRKENDLAKSHLLHRLGLLGIPWGILQQSGSSSSTFHEIWKLEWKPEFAVAIIEANVWGQTVSEAAGKRVIQQADEAKELATITDLLDRSILAGLGGAIDPLLARIQSLAAVSVDVRHLLDALLPMARVARYGDVRGTKAGHVLPILIGLFERAVVGLGAACSALDDEAAERMLASLSSAQQALDVLAEEPMLARWLVRLQSLEESAIHGLIRGWCCRTRLEKGVLDDDGLYRAARLALSPANPPAVCAAWATGLLRGSGLLLLHQDEVWRVFDRWLAGLTEEQFVELLPPLRRAFSEFTPPERRQMGDKVKRLGGSDSAKPSGGRRSPTPAADDAIDHERARLVLPTLAQILGVPHVDR